MRAIRFPGYTGDFAQPPEWDETKRGPVDDIPVLVTEQKVHITIWKPTLRERLLLILGFKVMVSAANYQPPMFLTVVQCDEVRDLGQY